MRERGGRPSYRETSLGDEDIDGGSSGSEDVPLAKRRPAVLEAGRKRAAETQKDAPGAQRRR